MSDTKKPNKNDVPAPWVPGATARRTVGQLTLVSIMLTACVVALGIVAIKVAKEPPKLVVNNAGRFVQADLDPMTVTRDDVELFVQLVIPRLYAQSGGEAPGLEQIRHMVNTNIITEQLEQMKKKASSLGRRGVTQFAIVNGVNPNTLVIDRDKKTIYVEAIGLIGLTDSEGRAQTVQTQWQMLMYMVDIIPAGADSAMGKRELIGNERGILLQQYREQKPGTVNSDTPKLRQSDMQEWEAQKKAKSEREALLRANQNLSTSEGTEPAPDSGKK